MIMLLIALLVCALVAGVLIWIVRQLPLPSPWGRVAEAVIVLIALLVFLERYAFPYLGAP